MFVESSLYNRVLLVVISTITSDFLVLFVGLSFGGIVPMKGI